MEASLLHAWNAFSLQYEFLAHCHSQDSTGVVLYTLSNGTVVAK